MLKHERHKQPTGFESIDDNDFNRERREELVISSPCPPPSMVLAHAHWLRAWESRCVGYSFGQCRRESLSRGTQNVLRTARAIASITSKLPTWPTQQTAGKRRAVIAAEIMAAAEGYDCTTGLLLLDKTGRGKTAGAVHLLFAMWERSFRERTSVPVAMFVKAADLAASRRCHPLGEGEPRLLVEATEAELLLLDDLGQDEKRDGTIFDVLDARYDAGLPSVVTSGFTLEQLSERYGQALVRRIVETNGDGRIVNGFKKAPLRAAQ
jgi:DNA replication protein DnaC